MPAIARHSAIGRPDNIYGITVFDAYPDTKVTRDIELDYRPGGFPLHTDRGADQLEPGPPSSARPSGPSQIQVTIFPNPFNPTTTISYVLAEPGHVDVRVYDAGGRLVRTLVDQHKPGGNHRVSWDGRDAGGVSAASGIYFVRAESRGDVQIRKVALLK